MSILDFFTGKQKEAILTMGTNYFIYISASGEVSFKTVEIQEYEEDEGRFHGIDLDKHENRTYKLDRVLRVFTKREIKKLNNEDINNILQETLDELIEVQNKEPAREKPITSSKSKRFNHKRVVDRNIDELIGFARGILADGKVDQNEAVSLQKWLIAISGYEHPILHNLLIRVNQMLEDGVLDDEESAELFETLNELTGSNFEKGEILKSTSLPLDKPEPEVVPNNSTFCCTGTFEAGTRKEIEEIIINNGGKPSRLNGSTNYLVIGAYATDSWAHSSYGRKIENALDYKKKGKDIKIISEHHLLKFLK
jgi:NAD-dependent DNA ligase